MSKYRGDNNGNSIHLKPNYIIGIGASADGLNPIKELIGNLPDHIGDRAVIVAQHVSPNYKSMLVELIGRETKLSVKEAKNDMPIEPNTIYTTPSDNNITIENGKFVLAKPLKTAAKPSIDLLFESIAKTYKEKSAGIVLSGTGKDGTQGIVAIKKHGGITLAQEPASAKYDNMPQSAINTGCVDFVLPASIIGSELIHIQSDPESYRLEGMDVDDEADHTSMMKVLGLLTARMGTDVMRYKPSTIHRRLEKRLHDKKMDDIDKYLAYVQEQPEELDALFESLLIGVTKFYRDKEAFEKIEEVLKNILENKEKGDTLRIWVPGCASGEEAYTYAIILHRLTHQYYDAVKVQIFATDIDLKALSKARKGIYSSSAIEDVPEPLRQEYFRSLGDRYELIKPIRKMVLFSKHDLTSNPPFLKLDLISCRNLLIYFNSALQSQIIPVFHYALHPNGYLVLGKSESIGHFKNLFAAYDFKNKIYTKKVGEGKVSKFPYLKPLQLMDGNSHLPRGNGQKKIPLSVADMVRETLYHSFEHPYVVIDENLDLVEINGDVGEYMRLKSGVANMNILKLINEELQIELRAVLGNVIRKSKTEISHLRKLKEADGKAKYIRLVGKPLIHSQHHNPLFLVIFEEIKLEKSFISSSNEIKEPATNPRIMELEHELAATKEHMNTLIQELETSNEELQALNEELQSSNEELQASNEELETANEELQSANEELETAYDEIKAGKAEIERQNHTIRQSENNIKTLLNNTLQAFILLDKNYQIITFNKTAFTIFQAVFGKGLHKQDSYIDYIPSSHFDTFKENFQRALRGDLVFQEMEVKNIQGEKVWIDFNFTPVMDDQQDEIRQVSISFIDRTQDKITLNERNALFKELQQRNKELSEVNAYLENFVHVIAHDMRSPVANLKYLADVFTSLDAEGQAKYVPLISKSINKLDNTLNGLVQIIDIKGQHNTKTAEPIDISEVIEQVLEEQQSVINETGAKIHIKNNFPGKIVYIRGYLESILRNMISNALKYRKKNQQPEICISVLPHDNFVFISVKDNGIGINLKKYGKKLFAPFSRLTKDTPGLGIGLHIMKTMVEKNGGSITVESKEGKGATFNVFLKEFSKDNGKNGDDD